MRQLGAQNTSGQDRRQRFTGTLRQWTFWVPATVVILQVAMAGLLSSNLARADGNVAGSSGSIQGEVRITRKLTSQRMRFRLYPDFKPLAPPAPVEHQNDERRNVVIYLKGTPSIAAPYVGNARRQIAQMGETFIPHVLPVQMGTTVDFLNQDPIFHNVFSLSETKSFDLGRYPKGEFRSVKFDQAGIVAVFCHLHSHMSAIIMVLDNPFFTVPDQAGRYHIDNIPPGTYTVNGWHERSDPVEQRVKVLAGQSVELNFTIPIEDEPARRP